MLTQSPVFVFIMSKSPQATAHPSNRTRQSVMKRVLTAISSIYGNPAWSPDESADGRDVLSALILTILSQSTTDGNRDVAYARLRRRFPTWEKVLEAEVNKVKEAIRPGGLSRQKSARIQALLAWLKKTRNELSAEFLRDLDLPEAMDRMGHLRGIGVKTLGVVLMFTCGRDVFPVDTHVHRVCRRLGLIDEKCSAEKAHAEMANLLRAGESYAAHVNFWKFGKFICRARRPNCDACPLVKDCVYPEKDFSKAR